MITVKSTYDSIDKPEMTDNFIIRSDKVLRVWDINTDIIGVSFISSYDTYQYQIQLEGKSKGLLASAVLQSIKTDIDTEIIGVVRIK